MVAAPGMPPEWNDVVARAQQVEKLNPAGIQAVADQFTQASKDSADHSVALRNATAALGGGTWTGPAADAFFAYVKQIGDAGRKVNDHLDEVARELSNLQTSLADVKGRIDTIRQQAQTDIEKANSDAVTNANAAEAMEREVREGKPGATMPSPTSAEIMAANARKTSGIAAGARDQIQGLLGNANEQINRVMGLVRKEVQGGYASVPPLGGKPKTMKSTGGLRSGSGGGSGGGGGGLGPSGGPPSSQPPGNVRQWIEEAIRILQAAGVPVTEADIDKIWTIIEKESGGNPNAINLWDSNAAKGHPSKGLMQCIDSTFNAHKLPGHDDIYNPVDNIIAGVRYTFSRYGGFDGHPGLKAMAAGGGYQGY
ncbi:transglycosylase SLT domain-containing protein [Amycolatopsis methanolica]|uniref:Lytic transglycosylase catalytic n=1 Tax=Amycolatopsis methanolica 239 TaxID=1068978 RepID=A0A076NA29_AMYME|nr:transglycosylase SLT domain-containing protein [Amycolatopsis methanolica]AIJ26952.1 Lytic transglycosylase catalytic [Amycolatopsis methanolica 239]